MTDRAGWYADPSGRAETYRWWDGAAWTRWLSDDADAPAPDEPGSSDLADGDAFVAEPEHDQPAIRLPLAVGITIGAVILAVILLGVTVSLTEDRLSGGPAIAPPPKNAQPIVALYDEANGGYVAGPVTMKFPGAPFECYDYVGMVRSGAEHGFRCDYAVHENYRKNYSWMADTGFGVLPDSMVVPDDLKATCQKVLIKLGTNGYEGVKLIDPQFKAEKLTGITNPPDEAMKVTGTFGYRVPNLPSTRGYLTFVVIKLKESGKHVVFYVDYPNDAPKQIVTASEEAFKSLTAR